MELGLDSLTMCTIFDVVSKRHKDIIVTSAVSFTPLLY